MSNLIEATKALYEYLKKNDVVEGYAQDEARMLHRDASLPVEQYPSEARKREVVVSRIGDTFHYAERDGFLRSTTFKSLWDGVILAAIADGYDVSGL